MTYPPALSAPILTPDWDGALCTETGYGDLWYPERGNPDGYQAAVRTCRTCPLIEACRDYAMTAGEEHGVWGGLTPNDRRKLRKVAA